MSYKSYATNSKIHAPMIQYLCSGHCHHNHKGLKEHRIKYYSKKGVKYYLQKGAPKVQLGEFVATRQAMPLLPGNHDDDDDDDDK